MNKIFKILLLNFFILNSIVETQDVKIMAENSDSQQFYFDLNAKKQLSSLIYKFNKFVHFANLAQQEKPVDTFDQKISVAKFNQYINLAKHELSKIESFVLKRNLQYSTLARDFLIKYNLYPKDKILTDANQVTNLFRNFINSIRNSLSLKRIEDVYKFIPYKNFVPYKVCAVCSDEQSTDSFYKLSCGHEFCKTCLKSIIKSSLDEYKLKKICCPNENCNKALSSDEISKICEDKAIIDRYNTIKANKSFIHNQIELVPQTSQDIETQEWILRNTRPCPTCKTNIQKTHGCKYMTCTNCETEFCWDCFGPYGHSNKKHNCIPVSRNTIL